MSYRTLVGAVTAVVVAALTVLSFAPSASAAPIRIMALGDSITGSPGCWRALLWQRLQNTGLTSIDFVGTLGPQGCGFPYDGENEGHGGALVTNVANQNQLPGWLSATRPDIVLMHFGTNDVWNNIAPATILAAYGRLVDQMRASNPAMRVLVAKIIPMSPANCAPCGQRVVALNDAIPGWAAGKTTVQSPVVVVDQWTGFSTAAHTYDGVHPNSAGDQRISDTWYPPLAAALNGVTPTPGPSSPRPSPSSPSPPSPSAQSPTLPSPGGGCVATYRVGDQWSGGFRGDVTVRNTGTAPTDGWTVRWTFANGQQVSQFWSAAVSSGGATVTARNLDWNRVLAPDTATTFGFLASWAGTNAVPTTTCSVG